MKYIYELILENYARYTCLLQSPRLGKFVSNTNQQLCLKIKIKHGFNPLDRGNWYQINPLVEQYLHFFNQGFQSPRSGKFVSDWGAVFMKEFKGDGFVSIPQIGEICIRFELFWDRKGCSYVLFQSPRSGKFVSDLRDQNTMEVSGGA